MLGFETIRRPCARTLKMLLANFAGALPAGEGNYNKYH